MMSTFIDHEVHPETNGDPDALVDEATEMLVVEPDPEWRVVIEHIGCDDLIQITCSSHSDAVTLLDRIEQALASGEPRIRPEPGHLISLVSLRQAWIDESRSRSLTATESG